MTAARAVLEQDPDYLAPAQTRVLLAVVAEHHHTGRATVRGVADAADLASTTRCSTTS